MHILTVTISVRSIVLAVLVTLCLAGCKKYQVVGGGTGGTDSTVVLSPLTDFTTTISATISGFVTDENDSAINKATVQAGGVSVVTDKYGYFRIVNASIVQNAAVVTVTNNGYFKSIKTWVATAGKPAFFRIKMIRKNIAGSVTSAAGGTVGLANGLKIGLPPTSVVNAGSNAAYTGKVNIAAYWIDPTTADIDRVMPGNLSGLNADNKLQLLASYSMAAVELTGDNGELLQLAPGKKASINFPLPSGLSATAPATIPLWYFNETTGLWKQEGSATKSGTGYTGEVSHFSFWNCDFSYSFVQFSCTVTSETGLPLPFAQIKISLAGNLNYFTFGYTNENGFASGLIPANSPVLLEIFNNYACGTAAYSSTFTTTYQPAPLGNIAISLSSLGATVSGSVVNCGNGPVRAGEIVVQNGIFFNKYPVNADGSFSFNQLVCGNGSNNITIVAIDSSTAGESTAGVYTIYPGNNTIPAIKTCIGQAEFISYSLNGTNYYYHSPVDLIQQQVIGGNTSIYWYYINNNMEFDFSRIGIAAGSKQPLFKLSLPFDQIPYTPNFVTVAPVLVNITEFGPVKYYMAGNFTGTIVGSDNKLYNMVCTFRLRRGD